MSDENVGTEFKIKQNEPTRNEKLATQLEMREVNRTEYRASKKELIFKEEENFSEIVLQKCSGRGDFFEIPDRSALIYYHHVLSRLKVKNVKFESDADSFFEQYKIGRIRVRGTSIVRKRIKTVGFYGNEYIVGTKLIFVLNRTFTKEQMRALERKEAKRRLDLNKTVEVKNGSPLFYRNLAELLKWFHVVCSSKLTKFQSQTNGVRIVTLVDDIMARYLHSTDLPDEQAESRRNDWIEIRRLLYKLKYEIHIIDVAKIWTPETCIKIFEQNEELIRLAGIELSNILKKGNIGNENADKKEVDSEK